MSQNFSSQVKQWIAAIQSGQFREVKKEIKSYPLQGIDESVNKSMLRLLIYLCQEATKVPPSTHQHGYDISSLCVAICRSFTSITDTKNYFSSLYHIVRILLDMKLFKDATEISSQYLMPPSIWHQQMKTDRAELEKCYTKLWSIFYAAIDKYLKTKEPGSLSKSSFAQLLALMEYQLNIESLSDSDGSKGQFLKLLHYAHYLEQLKCSPEQLSEFQGKFFVNYLSTEKFHLGVRNKYLTYQNAMKLIAKIAANYINDKDVYELQGLLQKLFNNFKRCMEEDRETASSFEHCREFCTLFVRRLRDFTPEDVEKMKQLTKQLQRHTNTYGPDSSIKHNIYSLSQILEALFLYWIDTAPGSNLPDNVVLDFLVNTSEVLNYHTKMLLRYPVAGTCNCDNRSCSLQDDKSKGAYYKARILNILQKMNPKFQLSQKLLKQFTTITEECVEILRDIQKSNCEHWRHVWMSAGNSAYNLAVSLGSKYCKEVAEVYVLLCCCIVKLNATGVKDTFFKNNAAPPLSVVLHRLSNLYYSNNRNREAALFAAFNVYLHPYHPECKGYRNWSFVQYKDPSLRNLTLVEFLRKNSREIRQIGLKEVDMKSVDVRDICIREIKSHLDVKLDLFSSITAVIDYLEGLSPQASTYVMAVHQLGYSCLNFASKESISSYISRALTKLKLNKPSNCNIDYHNYLISHLTLYSLIEDLREMEETTKTEMQNAKIKLYASNNAHGKDANVVPAYSQINLATAKMLATKFDGIYGMWVDCLRGDSVVKWNALDGTSIVRTVIVAGEYCRFYRYKNLEIKFWKLAYDLAVKTSDYRSIVYIVGRSIMSRYINDNWIKEAERIIATKLAETQELHVLSTIAMFKMSLSDYYYYIGRTRQAEKLFNEGQSVTTLDMNTNPGTFLLSQHIILTHQFHNYPPEKKNNLEYAAILAKSLYAMLTSDDMCPDIKSVERQLYEMDMLLEMTCHISVRMNALFSFREITAHLVRRLNISQKKIAVLRVAEVLKYLCVIDLSRNQLDDCEVKLQGLEHILKIETFEISMNSKAVDTCGDVLPVSGVSPNQAMMELVRDTPQNDTSPILRRERFAQPNFVKHREKCDCFSCVNEAYKFLVFSCTHIRAQLFALRNLTAYAHQHFEGALQIGQKLINLSRKEDNHQQSHVIDCVLFLFDYVRFLKRHPKTYEKGREFICYAVRVCGTYSLQCHPVYMSSMEIVFDYRSERVFQVGFPTSRLVVPPLDDVDSDVDTSEIEIICATPVRELTDDVHPGLHSPHRKNLAPLLTLTKATQSTVESDVEDISPGLLKTVRPKRRNVIKVKPVRRRLAEDADFNREDPAPESAEASASSESRSRTLQSTTSWGSGHKLSDLVDQAISIAPGLSRQLYDLEKKSSGGAVTSEELQKIISMLEKAKTDRPKSSARFRGRLDDTTVDNNKLNDMISTLTKMLGELSASSSARAYEQTPVLVNSTNTLGHRSKDVESITRRVEKMSINQNYLNPPASSGSGGNVNSDDEVVESSIVEPRRSRRIAGKKTTTDTKYTRSKR